MKKLLATFVLFFFSVVSFSQNEGKRENINDEKKKAKTIVEI